MSANRPTTTFLFLIAVCLAAAAPRCCAQSTQLGEAARNPSWTPPESRDAADMLTFIDELAGREPSGETEREVVEHQRKVAEAIAAAAQQGIALQPSAEESPPLHYYRLQALSVLQRMGDTEATAQFEEALGAARESALPSVGAVGVKFLVESRMEQWPTIAEDKKQDIVTGVVDYLKAAKLDGNDAHTIVTVADFLTMENEPGLANQLLQAALPLFRARISAASEEIKSGEIDAEELDEWIALLEGVQRKVNLPGKKVKLSGKLLDGSELDWSQYEGKVVLIDFWASTCGPCRAELPNVQQLYRAYHDKGFDVVGICIDATQEDAETAVRELKIPWTTLFSQDATRREWQDPRAVEFGVTRLPTAILLDQEHRVIHMNARGDALAEQLQSHLGKPLVQSDVSASDLVQQASAEE